MVLKCQIKLIPILQSSNKHIVIPKSSFNPNTETMRFSIFELGSYT